jgi:formate hydrogenlyase subunit 3/multisubunit Na+/H+ antiporter MnhD subunit
LPRRHSNRLPDWRTLLPLISFAVSILTLAGAPPLAGFLGRQSIYAALQPQATYILLPWLSASSGILLGLVRTYGSLWRAEPRPDRRDISSLHLLLILGLFLLCIGLAVRPDLVRSRLGSSLASTLSLTVPSK